MTYDAASVGLTPAEVASYYRFPDATGAGQRIALIELSGGYHTADLDAYFAHLPSPPVVTPVFVTSLDGGLPLVGTNSPLDVATMTAILDALAAPGASLGSVSRRFEPDSKAWSEFLYTAEVTIDVQIAGALAPSSAIDVYFASLDAEGLAAAITSAVATRPTVISISWGGAESWWLGTDGERRAAVQRVHAALASARDADITVCCSSGDLGAAGLVPSPGDLTRVNFPASSPHALACGGTALQVDGGRIVGETVWNGTVLGAPRASGGGTSGLFARPDYQASVKAPLAAGAWRDAGRAGSFQGRLVPDVAAHADRAHGYRVLLAGRPFLADGTSVASPLWAALLARVSDKIGRPVGWINSRLYQAAGAGCRDVTTGDNRLAGSGRGFTATAGWDACTGWGSPDGARLVELLAAKSPTMSSSPH